MQDLDKAYRRQRILLPVTIVLLAGSVILIFLGKRGTANWFVLVSSFANLMTAIALRKTHARDRS